MIKKNLTKPPLGWNSFDCYGIFANERVLLENLAVFEEKLKPHGYEYFVLDAGWYSHFPIPAGREFPVNKKSIDNEIDEWGRPVANTNLFPRGMRYVADRVHEKGCKFGIHIMRGIPRKAVEQNTPIKGTSYHARDIANTADICAWNEVMYGIDMSKPGAQEYYDSILELLCEYGIDFLKADDLSAFPEEVEAIAKAVEKADREIVYSISPGNPVSRANLDAYKRANMLRITGDVWDYPDDFSKCFERWEIWQDANDTDFWIDLDMIPFGALQVYSDKIDSLNEGEVLLAGRGSKRMCQLNTPQKRSFITLRALSASPLFMGGELTMTDQESFDMITHEDILACNQNGICGKQVAYKEYLDIRKAPCKDDPDHGWIGIFNRNIHKRPVIITAADMKLEPGKYPHLLDLWDKSEIDFSKDKFACSVEPSGVLFIKY
jgi:alpha-galactosidase